MEIDPKTLAHFRQQAKAHMRKRAKAVRGSMSKIAIAARSSKIVERLSHVEIAKKARKIALFFPMEDKNEVDLRAWDALVRQDGALVAYPSVNPDTREMLFRITKSVDALEERGLGFAEPDPDAAELRDPALVVVPALAVDLRGHRLGYGAGFYDRALAALRDRGVAFKSIVVAFDFQLVSEIPSDERDIACEWIVTDERSLSAEG